MAKKLSNRALIRKDFTNSNYTMKYLVQQRNRMAKLSNSRMIALEKHGMTYGAYRYIAPSLKGQGLKHFSSSPKYLKDKNLTAKQQEIKLKSEISLMQKFLQAPSSTVAGINKINKKRLATFEKNGIHFESMKEFSDFINSSAFTEFRDYYPSDEQGIQNPDGMFQTLQREKGAYSWADIQRVLEDYRNETSRMKGTHDLREFLYETFIKEEAERQGVNSRDTIDLIDDFRKNPNQLNTFDDIKKFVKHKIS